MFCSETVHMIKFIRWIRKEFSRRSELKALDAFSLPLIARLGTLEGAAFGERRFGDADRLLTQMGQEMDWYQKTKEEINAYYA